jgi:transcriptional regulator with XRE-family HTH domain
MSNDKLKNLDDSLLNNIIVNIKTLLEKQSLSIYEVEKSIGKDNLRFLLSGKIKNPSISTIYKISQKFRISIKDLISDLSKIDNLTSNDHSNSLLTNLENEATAFLANIQKLNYDFFIKNIVQNIQILMKEKSISIYEIEKSVGIHNVSRLLNRTKQDTSIFIIDEIAKKLGVTIAQLIESKTPKFLEEKISKELKSEIFNLEQNTQNILSFIQKLKNRIEN